MSAGHRNPLAHPEVQLARTGNYLIGFLLATALMAASLLVVTKHLLSRVDRDALVFAIALMAVLAQLRLLFHLGLSPTHRWQTVALAMIIPLFVMLIGLSLWMFRSLDAHMMVSGLGSPM